MRGLSVLIRVILLTITIVIASTYPLIPIAYGNSEMNSGYMTVVDEHGEIVLQTGLVVNPGAQFIDENNRVYEITAVEGTLARGRYSGHDAYTSLAAVPAEASVPAKPALISVYHTHTDECYTPTDGKPSIAGKGSIITVGDTFTQRLLELGYRAEHDKTLHDPHDANAYHRSRRTFMRLLNSQPSAIFDIHRDSAPLNTYQTKINGQDATKILLVVGRQNQNRSTTLNYARALKAAADNKYRGLIRGIFIAHGNYNQDLNPRSMLIEVGTQYNSREMAERSAALFADVVPTIISNVVADNQWTPTPVAPPAPPAGAAAQPAANKQYGYDILSLLGLLIVGIAAYLYLSTGSWQEAKRKLAQFKKTEFTNFLGLGKKRKD